MSEDLGVDGQKERVVWIQVDRVLQLSADREGFVWLFLCDVVVYETSPELVQQLESVFRFGAGLLRQNSAVGLQKIERCWKCLWRGEVRQQDEQLA